MTPHDRLRARIEEMADEETFGDDQLREKADAILRACLEAVERLPRHAGNRCVDVTDLRALFTGGAAKP